MTTTLRVAQFVYSNVEAEHSPTGRRGFQVWRWSKRLAPLQREIARRLEDFDWPAADAARDVLTVRRTFFQLPTTGDVVIARTVPVRERDRLNRTGRFHAHAVVVGPTEFAKVYNNPFALFKSFDFKDNPTQPVEGDIGGGEVEDEVTVAVGPPEAEPDAGVDALFPLLLRWLAADDPKPVALPAHPDRIERFLRELFRRLPADLRLKAPFDTLSSGQSLGSLPFRFAGAFDAPTLRDWVYRKVYRLDPDTGFNPPLTLPEKPELDALAAEWGPAADDKTRTHSYRLLRALADPTSPLPAERPDQAVKLVAAVPAAQDGFRARVTARLEKDLDVPELRELVRTDAEEFAGKLSPAALHDLDRPIPAVRIATWLLDAATNRLLAKAVADQLTDWINTARARSHDPTEKELYNRLSLLCLRSEPGGWQQVESLQQRTDFAGAIRWLREHPAVIGPKHPALTSPLKARERADRMVSGHPPVLPAEADQIGWGLVLASPNDMPAFGSELRFALACRGLDPRLGDYLHDESRRPSREWLESLAEGLAFSTEFAFKAWTTDAAPRVGMILQPPAAPAQSHFIRYVVATDPGLRRVLLREAAVRTLCTAPPPGAGETEYATAVERELEKEGFGRLTDELARLTTQVFGLYLGKTLPKHYGSIRSEARENGGRMWISVLPVPRTPDPVKDDLWRKIVDAAGKESYRESVRAAALVEAVLKLPLGSR